MIGSTGYFATLNDTINWKTPYASSSIGKWKAQSLSLEQKRSFFSVKTQFNALVLNFCPHSIQLNINVMQAHTYQS